ncbi:hypothetical protein CesoFtcFv8_000233 [Champsocephalus esox]|uniref:Uncharacterized protein n=1 Tax=Champsocephalus esox TaxID=159716 RepID=A0AAN8E4K1_9TELE|nr:hypothetical protein CesoFtcFv8_000233 [Champsocephalus esox]
MWPHVRTSFLEIDQNSTLQTLRGKSCGVCNPAVTLHTNERTAGKNQRGQETDDDALQGQVVHDVKEMKTSLCFRDMTTQANLCRILLKVDMI